MSGIQLQDEDASLEATEGEAEAETTPLHYAAAIGDMETLYSYCQQDIISQIDINARDPQGRTALIYSVLGDQQDSILLLISVGCNINATDSDGRTALHWSAYHGKHKTMKLLLENAASPAIKDNEGRTALHLSTGSDSSKCTKLLLRYMDTTAVNEADSELMTAAHWSAFHDHAKHLDLLISMGANILLPDREGRLPLHWTSTNTTQTTCNLILVAAPDCINAQDSEGRTALHLAVANSNLPIVDILTSLEQCQLSSPDNMRRTPLHWAAVLGYESLATLLLQRGADFAAVDENGATALHYAAQHENFSCLVSILAFPQVKDIPDKEGRTALLWAAGKGLAQSIEILASNNIDIQAYDKTGGTALHVAAFSGNQDCVEVLLKHGAIVEALDSQQHTPLFRACEVGHSDIVKKLLQANASANLQDVDGRSPLHWAALGGFDLICLLLLEAGVKTDPVDKQGRTPLHCATYGGHLECMSLLLQRKVEVNAQDNEGITSLHWACSIGYLDAIRLLFQYNAFPNYMEADGDKLTPLDYALMSEHTGEQHDEIIDTLVQHGALSVTSIKEMAAAVVQSCWKGFRARKRFSLLLDQSRVSRTSESRPSPWTTALPPSEAASEAGTTEGVLHSESSAHLKSHSLSSLASASRTALAGHGAAAGSDASVVELQVQPSLSAEEIEREMEAEKAKKQQELLRLAKMQKHLAQTERCRLASIRRMVEAAMVIQLAVRRFLFRRRQLRNLRGRMAKSRESTTPLRPLQLSRAVSVGSDSDPTRYTQPGPMAWQYQIAALTIQLAWRQFLRKKVLRKAAQKKTLVHEWTPSILAEKQRKRVIEIYGCAPQAKKYLPPLPKPMYRPAHFKFIVPAAVMSFKFALGNYTKHSDHDMLRRRKLQARSQNTTLSRTVSSLATTVMTPARASTRT